MNAPDAIDRQLTAQATRLQEPGSANGSHNALSQLLADRPLAAPREPLPTITTGELVAMTDDGCTPLVIFPGQPGSSALRARTVVDLHGAHIGKPVVLMFEGGDPAQPVVMGVLREPVQRARAAGLRPVEIEADGERMVVQAQDRLVLRCGKASITLTQAGKIMLDGTYVLSRSSGVNRVQGGSVQLN